jgi:hypothetical protein
MQYVVCSRLFVKKILAILSAGVTAQSAAVVPDGLLDE